MTVLYARMMSSSKSRKFVETVERNTKTTSESPDVDKVLEETPSVLQVLSVSLSLGAMSLTNGLTTVDRNFDGPARCGNKTIQSSPMTSSSEKGPSYLSCSGL